MSGGRAKCVAAVAVLVGCGLLARADDDTGGLPPDFTVTTDGATGGKLLVSANGTYSLPDTHEVLAAELRLSPSAGGTAPQPILLTTFGNGMWSLKNASLKAAGTYDAYAVFTFKKKNAKVGDVAVEKGSTPVLGVVVSP